jgi:hypothetical protein
MPVSFVVRQHSDLAAELFRWKSDASERLLPRNAVARPALRLKLHRRSRLKLQHLSRRRMQMTS